MARHRKPLTKARVRTWLERNFFLRVHMFFILSGTFGAGVLATKWLLALGVNRLALRYALAVSVAYLVFLLLIRVWMFYVRMARGGVDFTGDGLDWGRAWQSGDTSGFGGSGGKFGGGGASGSWGNAPLKSSASSPSSSSFSFDFGGDDLVVVILVIALVLSLLFVAIYIIYTAPALLSEAAFEAMLAAALAKRAKQIDRPGWMGVIWRATIWQFLLVLVLSAALGWAAQRRCPEAKRLRDVFDCPKPRPHDLRQSALVDCGRRRGRDLDARTCRRAAGVDDQPHRPARVRLTGGQVTVGVDHLDDRRGRVLDVHLTRIERRHGSGVEDLHSDAEERAARGNDRHRLVRHVVTREGSDLLIRVRHPALLHLPVGALHHGPGAANQRVRFARWRSSPSRL
jgi:hypothetical protein